MTQQEFDKYCETHPHIHKLLKVITFLFLIVWHLIPALLVFFLLWNVAELLEMKVYEKYLLSGIFGGATLGFHLCYTLNVPR